MSVEMKAVTQRFFGEVFSEGNLGLIEQVASPDYRLQAPPNPILLGQEGLKQFVTLYRTAFPDLRFTIEEQIVESDKVVTRWIARGTHNGPLQGIPPTGKAAEVTGITISRIVDGKMTEAWINWDMLGLLQQLGVAPIR
jgi:steroid delta-isomerase-like uncharacterized protein